MIERVFAPVAHKQVIGAVVLVIPDADTLSPAGAGETGARCDVREGVVAIVFVKTVGRRGTYRLEACAIHQEDVEPAVIVVVEERHSAARGLNQITIPLLA